MDEKDYELLHALDETRNITHAADKLYMTQSALSKRIKALEQELGVEIVLRSRQGIRFTPAGEQVLLHSAAAAREMEKMRRVIDREYPEATVRCLLVVDATTGQNGLAQARAFREAAGINGIVLTKLDGTAKGGIAFSIVRELGVPVMYVGVGEGIEDLQSFNAREFVDALFE